MLSTTELSWLTRHPEAVADAEACEFSAASEFADGARLRERYGEYARALIELVRARRKATTKRRPIDAKVDPALVGVWLADDEAIQQATPQVVALMRARRLAASPQLAGGGLVHDVTCSMGTEVVALAQSGLRVVGSDIDPARAMMAAHNVRQTELAEQTQQAQQAQQTRPDQPDQQTQRAWAATPLIARADALVPVTRPRVVVADPARRAAGQRITTVEELIPPLPDLLDAWRGTQLVIKCAPGIDYSFWDGEVEVTSVAGQVKEACLWTPALAEETSPGAGARVRRRATVVSSDGAVTTLTDAEPGDCGDPGVGRFLVEPDGAIVRAGLVRQAACRWGMRQLDPHLAYLTGDRRPTGVLACEVLEEVPLAKLVKAMKPYQPRAVEILVRGVAVNPDQLRARIMAGSRKAQKKGAAPSKGIATSSAAASSSGAGSLPADGSYTVVIARMGEAGAGSGDHARAFICGPRYIG